jgi:hypothetical protein
MTWLGRRIGGRGEEDTGWSMGAVDAPTPAPNPGYPSTSCRDPPRSTPTFPVPTLVPTGTHDLSVVCLVGKEDGPYPWSGQSDRIRPPILPAVSGGHCNASASLSDGVIHPRVCRGRPLS